MIAVMMKASLPEKLANLLTQILIPNLKDPKRNKKKRPKELTQNQKKVLYYTYLYSLHS